MQILAAPLYINPILFPHWPIFCTALHKLICTVEYTVCLLAVGCYTSSYSSFFSTVISICVIISIQSTAIALPNLFIHSSTIVMTCNDTQGVHSMIRSHVVGHRPITRFLDDLYFFITVLLLCQFSIPLSTPSIPKLNEGELLGVHVALYYVLIVISLRLSNRLRLSVSMFANTI